MTTLTLVQIFGRHVALKDETLLAVDIASYLTSTTQVSPREILDFRLTPQPFNAFTNLFRDILSRIRGSTASPDNCSNIETFLQLLVLLAKDHDFSYQFGDFGGHTLLKQLQREQGKLPVAIDNIIDEVIATILECGVQFPLNMSTSHKEAIVKPLVFDFIIRPVITYDRNTLASSTSLAISHNSQSQKLPCPEEGDDSMRVYVRQVPAGMHGAGQAAVGYVMWSSAVILSRWLGLNSKLFQDKRILEIGAGNALCGVTVASLCSSHVTMSDFNEVVLNNIESIVELNSGEYKMAHDNACKNSESCLGQDTSSIEVCRLDWNKLLPPECVPSDASSQSQSQSQGDLATSKHSELTDPDIYGTENQGTGVDVDECNPVYETFDVIIASDIVCCDSDAVGVAHTLLHFLKREGVGGLSTNPCPVAIFVVPSEFHRYGVKNLISTLLSVGLVVHWRYVCSSLFCNDAYTDSEQENGHASYKEVVSCANGESEFNVRGCDACAHLHACGKEAETVGLCCNACEDIAYNTAPLLESFRYTAEDDYLTGDLAEAPYYKWLFLVVHWQHPS